MAQSDAPAGIDAPVSVELPAYVLWIQLILFYGLIGGLIPIVFGTITCAGIWKRKKLRTRFFVIVACLSFVRVTIAIGYFILAVYRSLRTMGSAPIEMTRLACHSLHILLLYSLTIELGLLCFLVLDRIIAMTRINYYRLLSTSSALQICILSFVVIATVKLIPSYADGTSLMSTVKCINQYSTVSDAYQSYSAAFDLVLVFVILFLYIALIVYVRFRIEAIRESATDVGKLALQRQLKLMPILRNLILMHCGLALMAKLSLWLGNAVPRYQQPFGAAGGMLQCVDVFANVMSLFANRDIRSAAYRSLARSSNQVENLETNQRRRS